AAAPITIPSSTPVAAFPLSSFTVSLPRGLLFPRNRLGLFGRVLVRLLVIASDDLLKDARSGAHGGPQGCRLAHRPADSPNHRAGARGMASELFETAHEAIEPRDRARQDSGRSTQIVDHRLGLRHHRLP